MKARYYVWGALGGLAVASAPGSPLWVLPGLGLLAHMTIDERPELVMGAWPLLASGAQKARAALPAVAWQLPGVRAEERPQVGTARRDRPATAQRGGTAPAPWLRTLNDEPDRAPHALIFGPSGAGKTTFACATLGARDGAAVVLSPKVNPGNWAGAEVISLDDDGTYAPIAEALAALDLEKRRRIVTLRREGAQALTPLTVVLDELPELVENVRGAGPFAVSLGGIGRELKMRLVCLSTRDEALNIRGWKASQGNFVRVTLDRDRRGALDDGVAVQPIAAPATWGRMAERAQLRPWREPEPAPQPAPQPAPAGVSTPQARPALDLSDLLGDLLAAPVPSASASPGNAPAVPVTVTADDGNRNGNGAAVSVGTGPGNGPGVTVYAQAWGPGATRRPPRGRGLDVRRRRQLAEAKRKESELTAAYAEARARGVPSFRAAYAELGGNRDKALAAWQAAGREQT